MASKVANGNVIQTRNSRYHPIGANNWMRWAHPDRASRERLMAIADFIGWVHWEFGGAKWRVMAIEERRAVTPPALRVFRGISRAWRMDFRAEMRLLALPRPVWSRIARDSSEALTSKALRRIVFLAQVFEAINMMFPPERADAWMRAPNTAPMFGGRSAIELMIDSGPPAAIAVRQYLLSEIYG